MKEDLRMNKDSRSIKSIYNAISASVLFIINGGLGIVVTQVIIRRYGSDFNGLNSTANQIVNILLVLEGGFTLASNVALFDPISNHDYDLANAIINATQIKFKKVGISFGVLGSIVSVVYAYMVNSNLPREFILAIMFMTIVPQMINLFCTTGYRVLLQAQQKEYIINSITAITLGMGYLTNIIFTFNNFPMWTVRFVTMICALLNSLILVIIAKKNIHFLNKKVKPRNELILGTKDVMMQKITSVIYNTAPIIYLSISQTGGTMLASVYAVYNSIFLMIKSILNGVIDAPRLGIGQLLVEKKREEVWKTYKQYEYITFLMIFVLLTTTSVLILPFINLYTRGIQDINYYNIKIALLMALITVVEMMHIPSGHIINMSGNFKVSRNIQIIGCVVLLFSMLIGGKKWEIYGMLIAVLITAGVLALLEMVYVHVRFFERKISDLLGMITPLFILGIFVCFIEMKLSICFNNYFSFVIYGCIFIIINSLICLAISYIFNYKLTNTIIFRIKHIFKKNTEKFS